MNISALVFGAAQIGITINDGDNQIRSNSITMNYVKIKRSVVTHFYLTVYHMSLYNI